jgi:hypothetical protein
LQRADVIGEPSFASPTAISKRRRMPCFYIVGATDYLDRGDLVPTVEEIERMAAFLPPLDPPSLPWRRLYGRWQSACG